MKKKFIVGVLAAGMCINIMASAAVVTVPDAGVTVLKKQVEDQSAVSSTSQVSLNSVVNWDKGKDADIIVIGFGVKGNGNIMMARRAAVIDGYRNLAETIAGVQVDSKTLVKDLSLSNDVVRTNVSVVVKGARIIEEGELSDGNYYVKMSLPLYGEKISVASAVLPEALKNVKNAELEKVTKKTTVLDKYEYNEVKDLKYTGIVIDCRGLGLDCTFAPQILDDKGRAIYGCENIDIDFAISKGMVEYSKDMDFVMSGNSRAGNNPLVIKANVVKGGSNSVNPVNAVVAVDDGDKILLAMQSNKKLLEDCAVVFVR